MYRDFVLHAVHGIETFSVFSTYTSRPVSSQWSNEAYGVWFYSVN